MFTVAIVLIFLCCILLVLAVLVQNSKGGGLASGFGGSNQVMGVRKTTDFLEKFTWGLASGLVILCLLTTFILPNKTEAPASEAADRAQEAGTETQKAPAATQPTSQPATQPAGGTQPGQ